jgi:hypothetical protein
LQRCCRTSHAFALTQHPFERLRQNRGWRGQSFAAWWIRCPSDQVLSIRFSASALAGVKPPNHGNEQQRRAGHR